VNGALEFELLASITVLNRVMSGGFAVLTGPFSSPATKPCSWKVTRLAILFA